MTKPLAASLPAKVAQQKSTQLIDILKTDHRLDILKDIVEHIGLIKRAKKIRPLEKHRLLQNYYTTLLSYCVPKMKVVEDNTNKNSTPMNFQINIGVSPDKGTPSTKKNKSQSGMKITIPTQKNKDGSYSVSAGE